MDFLQHLNPEQRDAVLQADGPLLILAGAGSGKTRVIAYRIAYLIGAGHASPREVVALTFTNKAADEMRERVERLLGAACEGAWISTFHALCARLLRREAPAIGLPRDFVIYDTDDQKAVMKRVLRDLGVDEGLIQPAAALARISHAKNLMQGPEAFAASGFNPRERHLGAAFEKYTEALAASHALDFDDLLLRSVELFDTSAEVRARYAGRFRFVMVDEYQDTNRPQYLLVRRLAEVHRNLCVVGDPDQSIYKWRGADIRNILDFERDFPEATVVRLERNYRSTQIILDAASAVIRNNPDRKEKRLWTDRKGGAKVSWVRAGDEWEEAECVAGIVREERRGAPDGAVAVLYRTNAQSRVLEDVLRREGLPYRIIGSVSFYERREVKDAVAYLKLLLNPDDAVSLRRVINVPARGIGPAVLASVEAVTVEARPEAVPRGAQVSPWSRIVSGLDAGHFAPRATVALRGFRDLILGLREVAAHEPVSTVLGKALDRSGYLRDLREDRDPESESRIENLMELMSAAREYEARGGADASLAGFVDRLSLISDTDKEKGPGDAPVLMMTLHAAKGLEFPVVVITGLEEGLFPHSRSSAEDRDLEEERRLCYVGMTRARTRLVLTCASRRRVFGEYQPCQPSRFIDEIPPSLIDYIEPHQTRAFGGPYARGAEPSLRRPHRTERPHERVDQASGPAYDYASEDQSRAGISPGVRVRHPQFGVGTVLSVEDLGHDLKLTVRFVNVGQKRLLASYARLERL
jgi:DNA helicase-2/ATP-dependent DNA helicase PcrA